MEIQLFLLLPLASLIVENYGKKCNLRLKCYRFPCEKKVKYTWNRSISEDIKILIFFSCQCNYTHSYHLSFKSVKLYLGLTFLLTLLPIGPQDVSWGTYASQSQNETYLFKRSPKEEVISEGSD